MFRFTPAFLGISPYSVFLKANKNNLALQGLNFTDRTARVSQMWRDLDVTAKASFVDQAKNTPTAKKTRTGYQLFMKQFGLTGKTVGSKWDLLGEKQRAFMNEKAAKGATRITPREMKKIGLGGAPAKTRAAVGPNKWALFVKENGAEMKGLSADDRRLKMKELSNRFKAQQQTTAAPTGNYY